MAVCVSVSLCGRVFVYEAHNTSDYKPVVKQVSLYGCVCVCQSVWLCVSVSLYGCVCLSVCVAVCLFMKLTTHLTTSRL